MAQYVDSHWRFIRRVALHLLSTLTAVKVNWIALLRCNILCLLYRKLCLLAGVFYESQYREWVYVQCVCECLQWLSYYICQGGNVSLLCVCAGLHKSYRINLNKTWWNDRKWAKKDFFGSFFFCLVWFYAVNIMVWFLLFIQLLFCCIALSLCYNPVFRLL